MPHSRVGGGLRASRSWVLAASVALTPGCSYIFTSGGPPPHCSTSKAPPILDTVFGGFEVVRTGIALSNGEEDYVGAPISREADILLGLGFTALFIASAYYGYSTTSECRQAQDGSGGWKEPRGSTIDESGAFLYSEKGPLWLDKYKCRL